MKKIISLMVLLLMVSMVSAVTTKESFTTSINITNNGTKLEMFTESGSLGPWTCSNGTMVGNPYTNYPITFLRDISHDDIALSNLTGMMKELTEVSLELVKYGNDSKKYQTLYNEKNEAWGRVCENYEECKKDREIYKNDSIQLTTCQSDLINMRVSKNQCTTEITTCAKDLEDQKASTQTAWIVAFLAGLAVMYGFVEYRKKYEPAESGSFQH